MVFNSDTSKKALQARWSKYHEQEQNSTKESLPLEDLLNGLDLRELDDIEVLNQRCIEYLLKNKVDAETHRAIRSIRQFIEVQAKTIRDNKGMNEFSTKHADLMKKLQELKL